MKPEGSVIKHSSSIPDRPRYKISFIYHLQSAPIDARICFNTASLTKAQVLQIQIPVLLEGDALRRRRNFKLHFKQSPSLMFHRFRRIKSETQHDTNYKENSYARNDF
jgi:hypothetical protein